MKKLFLSLVLMPLMALADTETVDGITWTYTIIDGKAQVGTGASLSSAIPSSTTGAITIPPRLGDCPVTCIGKSAFYYCSKLTSVTIPEGVISIGPDAFRGCRGLTSVMIPSGVTSIGSYAFYDCCMLTSATIPSSVTSIGDGAFSGCSGLTTVSIPASVSSIGKYVFYCCSGLTSVTIPAGVVSIGSFAFYRCSELTSVSIPPSLMSVGGQAFDGCNSLDAVYISDLSTWCNINFAGSAANPLCYAHHLYLNEEKIVELNIPDDVTSVGDYAFYGCNDLTDVRIPKGVSYIGYEAFRGCENLISIAIPSSVMRIGCNAFSGTMFYDNLPDGLVILGNGVLYGCKGECPSSVLIPEGVTRINDSAFFGCSGLTSVTIPSSVTSIGADAFEWCDNLTSVVIPEGVTKIESAAFAGCRDLASVTIPSSVASIEGYAFYECSGLGVVEIPNGVIEIGAYAFSGCSGLWSAEISSSVTSIGDGAFEDCSGLFFVTVPACVAQYGYNEFCIEGGIFAGCDQIRQVVISDGVTSIGDYAFAGCTCESIEIPSSVTSIGNSAFEFCGITEVVIPEGVTSLADSVFSGCENLTSVTIPESVTSIGNTAFYGSGITSVRIPCGVTSIGESAFADCYGLSTIVVDEDNQSYKSVDDCLLTKDGSRLIRGPAKQLVQIPEGVTDIGGCAFSGCRELVSVSIPDGVISIGYCAFNCCESISAVTIPDSVTSIENDAFSYCRALESVAIPSSVTNIGCSAFSCCDKLSFVTIPEGVKSIDSQTFFACKCLTSVTVPPGVTDIGYEAFYYCSGLVSIEIPSSVVSIGRDAFYWCTALQTVITDNGCADQVKGLMTGSGFNVSGVRFVEKKEDGGPYEEEIDGILWAYTINNGKARVGAGNCASRSIPVTTAGTITIPSALGGWPVTSVADYAFYCCSEVTSVTIPDGVTRIGDYAFCGCRKLRSVVMPSSVQSVGPGAFDTGASIDSLSVPDLEAYASICFANYSANPRNRAENFFVGNELLNEMCRVSYSLASDDMYDYMWYAEFNGYDETWTISDYWQTASCEVPIGSTICFDDLSGGAVTISEWGDHAFDGWDGDGVCAISDTEVVAKWRVKTLEEVLGYLLYSGAAWGKQQYFFFDANSGCLRSQGELCFGMDPESDEYSSYSYIAEELKRTGQLLVVMVGYDENYQEVAQARFPVFTIAGKEVWSGALFETNCVKFISLKLAHSCYEGRYDLCNTIDNSYIWEEVDGAEIRYPNVHYINLEGADYNCYDHRYTRGYDGNYDLYYYNATMSGKAKSGDVLSVTFFGGWYGREEWRNNDFMDISVDVGQDSFGSIYSSDSEFAVSTFTWIIPPGSQEEAREPRRIVFETRARYPSRSWHHYYYEIEVAPDIITHRVLLNNGLQCDLSQTDITFSNQIVDDGLLPEFPIVYALPGWRFLGWSPDPSIPVTEDIEYVAQYEPITYGITFEDVKGCENANTNAYTVEDEVVFLPLHDLPDWHFDGWSPATIPMGSTGDVTVVAQWRPIETAEIVGAWSEPKTFEYDGQVHGVDYSARLDVMEWPLNVVTQGTIRAVNVGEYAATATAEAVGVPETDAVYYRCAAVTNECKWTITPKPVTKLQVSYVSTAMIANGQQQKPQIVVRDVERGVVLTSVDYALSYENNVEPGMGIARITGKGNYGGETTIEFPIVAAVSPTEGLNMDGGTFEIVGETDWVADNAVTHDGYASMRSGAIGDTEKSVLTAVVHGAGIVSFWWKVSSQHFDSVLELDRLEFYVDGVRQKWANGDVDWTKLSFMVNGVGPHELKWVYAKDGSVSERQDCGWVDEVSWEKEWLIGDWLNDVDREFATSNVKWTPDATVSSDDVGSMRSGACLPGQRSVLSTVVENVGTLTFKWKSSCVAYGEYVTDKLSLLVDGVAVKDAEGKDIFISGQTGWRDVSYRITGAGRHEVRWVFEKVSDASMGQNCGWVDVVRWDNEPGTLTDADLVVAAFDGAYDGREHGAAVSVAGARNASVKYGASRETIGDAESPTFVNCGEHEVWFAVNVPDFHEYVGKTIVRIRPRSIESGEVTLGEPLVYSGTVLTLTVASVVVDGLTATFEVSDNEACAAGPYRLTVAGTGNFCGELSVPFTVAKAQAPAGDVTVEGRSPQAGAVEFAYDGKAHLPTVVAGYDGAAVVRFALAEEGPYADELNVSNVVECMDVWYEIVSANYERLVGRTQMTIRPLSIAGAEVVLGEQVSDVEGHVVQPVDSVIVNGLSATFVVSNNVATAEGDFELCVYGVGNFTGEAKCPYSVGGVVLPPLMTPGDGTIFTESLIVRFSAQTPDSKWYYTLDGSMPTTNSLKASCVNLHGKTTIRAIAVVDGKLRSAVAEAHYALGACENPTVRLDGQDGCVFHFPGQLVVIDRNGEEGVVRYTLDGSEPTAKSPAYEGPFAISASTIVKAKTFSDCWFDSETVTADMRLEVLSVPSPAIQSAKEYRGTRTTVSMSCALVGAVIRYTLDGSEPTLTSALYEKPFEIGGEVGSEVHVKARAFREGYADSSVAEVAVARVWGIGDTLGVPDLMFTTDDWVVDAQETFAGRETMRSGPTDDGETNALEAVVQGGGALAFSWRTSCEDSFGDFIWDRAEFWVDETCVAKVEGETSWHRVEHAIPDDGADHVLRWLYVKDPELETAEGEDCVWLAALSFERKEALSVIVVEDPNGKIVLPAGKDISEVEVKVMCNGSDIFPYLNLPAAVNGVIDLSRATVKEEIAKEPLDTTKGATIELDAGDPKITTAPTRAGLFYQLREGETLGGMKDGDSKVGDGQPWTPMIKVKGGTSAFYTIAVGVLGE